MEPSGVPSSLAKPSRARQKSEAPPPVEPSRSSTKPPSQRHVSQSEGLSPALLPHLAEPHPAFMEATLKSANGAREAALVLDLG